MSDEELKHDRLFRAISDPNRRKIIEILNRSPGISIGEITTHFPTSRFAVMKHLNVLEEAGVLRRTQEGTSKYLFLNAGALRFVREWLGAIGE